MPDAPSVGLDAHYPEIGNANGCAARLDPLKFMVSVLLREKNSTNLAAKSKLRSSYAPGYEFIQDPNLTNYFTNP
ncbi:hypothetical protein N7451_001063 [Penicillium sp. IBT 35674x]|nr:hypothetical protein N7451_001063 [Penicillium sp. IBT 35674x]